MHKANGGLVNTGRRVVDGPPAAPPTVHFYGAALIGLGLMIASLFVLFRVGHVGMDFIRRCVRPRAINALLGEGPCGPPAGSPEGSPTRKREHRPGAPVPPCGTGVWGFHISAENGSGRAALPPDLRKGFAFPQGHNTTIIPLSRGYASAELRPWPQSTRTTPASSSPP